MSIAIRPACLEDAKYFSSIGANTFVLACPPSTPKSDLDTYIASELSPNRFREHIACPTKFLLAADVGRSVVVGEQHFQVGSDTHEDLIMSCTVSPNKSLNSDAPVS